MAFLLPFYSEESRYKHVNLGLGHNEPISPMLSSHCTQPRTRRTPSCFLWSVISWFLRQQCIHKARMWWAWLHSFGKQPGSKQVTHGKCRSANKHHPYLRAPAAWREVHCHPGRGRQRWNISGASTAATARPTHRLELQQPLKGSCSYRCFHAS